MTDKTRKYIDELHAYAEMLHKAKVKHKLQCTLRWSANQLAVLSRKVGE